LLLSPLLLLLLGWLRLLSILRVLLVLSLLWQLITRLVLIVLGRRRLALIRRVGLVLLRRRRQLMVVIVDRGRHFVRRAGQPGILMMKCWLGSLVMTSGFVEQPGTEMWESGPRSNQLVDGAGLQLTVCLVGDGSWILAGKPVDFLW
jgi:hypothetical protein